MINSNMDHIVGRSVQATADGLFEVKGDIERILRTKDEKMEFIYFKGGRILVGVLSNFCAPSYYELVSSQITQKIKAVLMDLDGTTVLSEKFWIEMIRLTVSNVLETPSFQFEEQDFPFISGNSVLEHLAYCKEKYHCKPELETMISLYYTITRQKLYDNLQGSVNSFLEPQIGLREFLILLKKKNIKVGLVTSGVNEKAIPEIESVFKKIGLGKPEKFYNCIITAGVSLKGNGYGTMGELAAKPHPWLYREAAFSGLGISYQDREQVICIEDSAAGVYSTRLAGFPTIGISGGNIVRSGCQHLCQYYADSLKDIADMLFQNT